MTKQNTFVYFLGTAGAGKSSLAGAYLDWCRQHAMDALLVNLDPGVDALPYTPDVDVRDWVKLEDVMASEGLGPNGAQVAAADLVALQAEDLRESIESFQADHVLVDTPGQIELFVFRQSGKFLMENLAPERSVIAYLLDPILSREPSSFVSQMLLSLSVQFRLGVPMAHLLSKRDVLEEQAVDTILEWAAHPDALMAAVEQEQASLYREMNVDLLRSVEGLGAVPGLFATSAAELEGLDDLYAAIQLVHGGGEDPMADALDPKF
jgi:GTPase SAR1 family protein